MNAFGKMRAFTGVLLLGPTLAWSDGIEPVAQTVQKDPVQVPQVMPADAAPAMPAWPQPMMAAPGMMPPGMMPYGGMPPGMMWPMQAPMPMPVAEPDVAGSAQAVPPPAAPTETAGGAKPSAPAVPQGMVPAMPAWPQPMMAMPGMMPPGMMPYGGMPPGMMWPMQAPTPMPVAEPAVTVPTDAQGATMPSVPAMPAWPQPMTAMPGMMPPGMMPYGGMPPGMMWPIPQALPAPMMQPNAPQIVWVPFLRVLAPMEGAAAPAVNYGPVADTPVVSMPPAPPSLVPAAAEATATERVPQEKAADAPAKGAAKTPVPAVAAFESTLPALTAPFLPSPTPAAAEATATERILQEKAADAPAKGAAVSPAPAVAAIESPLSVMAAPALPAALVAAEPVPEAPKLYEIAVSVDYGPVAPTPVVMLAPPEQPEVAPQVRKRTRSAVKASARKAVAKSPTSSLKSGVEPVKKRLCWTQGVVAPCR